jgi:hypothetical protein
MYLSHSIDRVTCLRFGSRLIVVQLGSTWQRCPRFVPALVKSFASSAVAASLDRRPGTVRSSPEPSTALPPIRRASSTGRRKRRGRAGDLACWPTEPESRLAGVHRRDLGNHQHDTPAWTCPVLQPKLRRSASRAGTTAVPAFTAGPLGICPSLVARRRCFRFINASLTQLDHTRYTAFLRQSQSSSIYRFGA